MHRAFSTAVPVSANSDELYHQIPTDDGLDILPNFSTAMKHRTRGMKQRHDTVMKKLHEGGDQTKLGKELSSLSGVSSLCDAVMEIHASRASLLELKNDVLNETEDDDSKELLEEIHGDLSALEFQLPLLSQKLMKALVPVLNPDEADELTSSDAVIDIRAGTGGDEACLFAAKIMAGYEAIARAGGADEGGRGRKQWDVEVLSASRTPLGGLKEVSLAVSSRGGYTGGYCAGADGTDPDHTDAEHLLRRLGPYGFFQFESGVHRVQRVPINDVRMQTSAVSVAVLPAMADARAADALPPSELRIETMRASGAGGQHVNTTESAVRITHVPTGIAAYMQEERSQHKNKAKGLRLVAARVHQKRREEARSARSAARGSLMGGGDRSERIRTYNFPQDRITDHRCKVSVQGLPGWLDSGMMVRKFGPHLYEMERQQRAVAMEEEDEKEERNRRSFASRKGKTGKTRR